MENFLSQKKANKWIRNIRKLKRRAKKGFIVLSHNIPGILFINRSRILYRTSFPPNLGVFQPFICFLNLIIGKKEFIRNRFSF